MLKPLTCLNFALNVWYSVTGIIDTLIAFKIINNS